MWTLHLFKRRKFFLKGIKMPQCRSDTTQVPTSSPHRCPSSGLTNTWACMSPSGWRDAVSLQLLEKQCKRSCSTMVSSSLLSARKVICLFRHWHFPQEGEHIVLHKNFYCTKLSSSINSRLTCRKWRRAKLEHELQNPLTVCSIHVAAASFICIAHEQCWQLIYC